MVDLDRLDAYNFDLPAELIAQEPLPERDASRLLVVDRASRTWTHSSIRDLPQWLGPGDRLVLNNSRVVPAKLHGRRASTGGKWEGLFLSVDDAGDWRIIGSTRGRLVPGEWIELHRHSPNESSPMSPATIGERLQLRDKDDQGVWRATPERLRSPFEVLAEVGSVPLPPYISDANPRAADPLRYQTVYADRPGSVAAPTAGLHFTPGLFEAIHRRGVDRSNVTLHVGLGTFRPVAAEQLAEHRMHAEQGELTAEAASELRSTRSSGGRIVAVGTTSVRVLESAAASRGFGREWRGSTSIFIRPPYAFQSTDALLTNFHLPKSTLLMLVSAFADRDLILAAYQAAIADRYRFFSYGDAMFIR